MKNPEPNLPSPPHGVRECPFCGGPAISAYIRDGRHIVCQSCHAEGQPAFHGRLDGPSAEERAVAAWNRRASDHRLAELTKERDAYKANWERAQDAAARYLDRAEAAEARSTRAEGLLGEAVKARPLDDWHEDDGHVLWWRFPICEPPYSGTPLDGHFPGYHTHWTRLLLPAEPSAALLSSISGGEGKGFGQTPEQPQCGTASPDGEVCDQPRSVSSAGEAE